MVVEYRDIIVEVRGTRISGTRMEVRNSKGLSILVDKHGSDECFSPLDYLLASLAGCINVVGHIVAKEMGIDIEGLEVIVRGTFNPGKLLANVGERAGFKGVEAEVRVKASADEGKLRAWLNQVLERCPIEDNLTNATPVKANLIKE